MKTATTGEVIPANLKVISAAILGGAAGLVGTLMALGSIEFAIFGGIGGAVATAIVALSTMERGEV